MKRNHCITRKAVAGGERCELIMREFTQAAEGSDPQVAFGVLIECGDQVVRESVHLGKRLEDSVRHPRQATAGADPEIAATIQVDRSDIVVRQTVSRSIGRKPSLAK